MNVGDVLIAKDDFHMQDYNYELFLLKNKSYRVNDLDHNGFFNLSPILLMVLVQMNIL